MKIKYPQQKMCIFNGINHFNKDAILQQQQQKLTYSAKDLVW